MNQAEIAKIVEGLASRGVPFAVATVVRTEGSSLAKPGFKVILSDKGEVVYGSLGGVCPESAIAALAKKTMRTGTPKVVKVFLEDTENAVGAVLKSQSEDEIHVETNCGGVMEIYVEPYLPRARLVLIGQGGKDEVEDALVSLGKSLDYEVVVIDHSPMLTTAPDEMIKDPSFEIGKFNFSESDSVVVLTRGEGDIETLQSLAKFRLRYVGMLASRQRVREDIARLRVSGVSEDFVASFRAPIGVDIGAVTASEIALSIMSEIVATKYGKDVPRKALGSKE